WSSVTMGQLLKAVPEALKLPVIGSIVPVALSDPKNGHEPEMLMLVPVCAKSSVQSTLPAKMMNTCVTHGPVMSIWARAAPGVHSAAQNTRPTSATPILPRRILSPFLADDLRAAVDPSPQSCRGQAQGG